MAQSLTAFPLGPIVVKTSVFLYSFASLDDSRTVRDGSDWSLISSDLWERNTRSKCCWGWSGATRGSPSTPKTTESSDWKAVSGTQIEYGRLRCTYPTTKNLRLFRTANRIQSSFTSSPREKCCLARGRQTCLQSYVGLKLNYSRILLNGMSKMDFRLYPMDKQTCDIEIESSKEHFYDLSRWNFSLLLTRWLVRRPDEAGVERARALCQRRRLRVERLQAAQLQPDQQEIELHPYGHIQSSYGHFHHETGVLSLHTWRLHSIDSFRHHFVGLLLDRDSCCARAGHALHHHNAHLGDQFEGHAWPVAQSGLH